MKKKTEEIFLKINKGLYKKKDLKIIPNKKSTPNLSNKNNTNKERTKYYNLEIHDKYYIPKKINYYEKEIDNMENIENMDNTENMDNIENMDNSENINNIENIENEDLNVNYKTSKILNGSLNNENNGSLNNENSSIIYNERFMAINGQKNIDRYSMDKYENGNENEDEINLLSNIEYYIDKNGIPKSAKYLRSNSINNDDKPMAYIIQGSGDKNTLIDLKGNIIPQNEDGDYSISNEKVLLIKNFDVQHPELRVHGEGKHKFENNCDESQNNISSNNSSPKLFFDYKRVTNLLANNNSIENNNSTENNNINLFRKKKINIGVNNNKISNMYSPLTSKQITTKNNLRFQKNSSFNNNKKLINDEDNNDDIQFNESKCNKKKKKGNSSSIALNNNNNTNSDNFEKDYKIYISPSNKNNISNFNNNIENKPTFKTTENKNIFLANRYSPNNIYSNSSAMCSNHKFSNKIEYSNKLKKRDKCSSAINIFNKNEKNVLSDDNKKENKNIDSKVIYNNDKKKLNMRKNNSFNKFNFNANNNNSLPVQNKELHSIILNDDINNNINNKKNKSDFNNKKNEKKLDEQNIQILSKYYSSNIQDKKIKNKRKNFCFNNNNDSNTYNNNNIKKNKKINIKKISINNVEDDTNIKNEDNNIYSIINKYKNKSILNCRHSKNQKIKNLLFSFERLFKQKNPTTFHPKTDINKKFLKEDLDKDDINYKKNKTKKCKIKYLTPNAEKYIEINNYEDINEKNRTQIYTYNQENSNKINENVKRKFITDDEKNIDEFDFNITQSKTLLNNINYGINLNNYKFRKVKSFVQKNFSSLNQNKLKERKGDKKTKKLLYSISNNIIPNNQNYLDNFNIDNNNINNREKRKLNINMNYYYDSKNEESKSSNRNNLEDYSDLDKENNNSNSNINIVNKELLKNIKKPVIINSQSCIYDNYGHENNRNYKPNNKNKKNNNRNEYFFNNKTINNCSNRHKNILRNNNKNKNNINKKDIRKKYEKNNCNDDEKKLSTDNLLLITNITKCPQCHCLFGQPSQLLNNKNE